MNELRMECVTNKLKNCIPKASCGRAVAERKANSGTCAAQGDAGPFWHAVLALGLSN